MTEQYIIADIRPRKHHEKYVSFLRPDGLGYVTDLRAAGAFDFQQLVDLDLDAGSVFLVIPLSSVTSDLLHSDTEEGIPCVIPNTLTCRRKLMDRKLILP